MKELLARKGYTQRGLSDEVGLTEKAINDMARGVSFPRLDRAADIARALKVSLNELAGVLGIPMDGIPESSSNDSEQN